jgi:hypothetical protein
VTGAIKRAQIFYRRLEMDGMMEEFLAEKILNMLQDLMTGDA